MKRVSLLAAAAGVLAVCGALATACSSNTEEAAPTRPPVPPVVTDVDGGDAGVDAAPVDPGCVGPDGCFKCEPTKHVEVLNACTGGQCTPFDNAARLPLFKAGQPLPPVP
jgi:hypothetical protein